MIFKGTVKYNGESLGPGNAFGERDFLLTGTHVMYTRAKCKTYLHADLLKPEELWKLAADFPQAMEGLKRHVLFEAFRAYMMRLAFDKAAAARATLRGKSLPPTAAIRLANDAIEAHNAPAPAAPSSVEQVSRELITSITTELLMSKKVQQAMRKNMSMSLPSQSSKFFQDPMAA
jgi:hypothetical protein